MGKFNSPASVSQLGSEIADKRNGKFQYFRWFVGRSVKETEFKVLLQCL
jgi:hypothetical protein